MIRPARLLPLLLSSLIAGPTTIPTIGAGSKHQAPATPVTSQKTTLPLEQGKPIESELAAGEAHTFRVTLTSGQFLRVVVAQNGIKVKLTISGPDGKPLVEQSSAYGRQGPVSVSLIAAASGDYTIKVNSTEQGAPAGRYEIRIEALREPTTADHSRVAAEGAIQEARGLRSKPTEENLLKALEKYKQALPHWQTAGDPLGEANTLQSMAITHRDLGDMREAIKYYEMALSVQKAAGDRRGEGYTLNFIGLAHANLGEFNKAKEYYDRAFALWQGENDKVNLADTYNRMGGVYDGVGDLQKALVYYQDSLQLRQDAKDLRGMAQSLNNIGLVHDKLADAEAALDYYNRALSIFQAVAELRSVAKVLNNLGFTYASMGDFEKGLSYFEQVQSIHKEIHEPIDEAATLANIGYFFASSNNLAKALEYYGKALSIQSKLDNPLITAPTLVSIGQIHASLGNQQKALESYERALVMFEQTGDQQGKASALDKMAQVFASQGRLQDSFNNYNKALQIWREVGDRRGEATTLYGLGRLERDRGNLLESLKNSKAAIGIVESLRSNVASQQLRTTYLASVRDYYDLNIDTLMRLHKADPSAGYEIHAFEVGERSRARSLLELLGEARVNIRQKVDAALSERERFLRQEIDSKEQARVQLLNGKHTAAQAASAEKELSGLIERYQTLLTEIKVKNPIYAALTQPQPLTLKEIQRQVLDPDTLLLEYSLGDERSYLWAATQTSIKSFELPGRAELEAQAKRVYNLLIARQPVDGETQKQYQARVLRADADYWPQAARLSRMLLGPVASELGTKRLLVVPEGALQYVPLSALPSPSDEAAQMSNEERRKKGGANLSSFMPRPLIMDHEIINLPSASVLAILRREIAGRKPAAKAVAVLADPVFGKDDPRIKSSKNSSTAQAAKQPSGNELSRALRDVGITRDGLNLQRLYSTRQEAEEIIAVAPDSSKALDFQASLETALNPDLGKYRIVHFATHGLLNDKHPELSGIVLSLVDDQGEPQNGFLRLHDIYNLNLPAELVVLSACSTALGKEIRGEGLVGLTRGFMYAGAARVIASLWKVRDLVTADLMKRFYKAMMVKGLRPAAALREAQMEMWKHRSWNAPYHWAAFILQGEWR